MICIVAQKSRDNFDLFVDMLLGELEGVLHHSQSLNLSTSRVLADRPVDQNWKIRAISFGRGLDEHQQRQLAIGSLRQTQLLPGECHEFNLHWTAMCPQDHPDPPHCYGDPRARFAAPSSPAYSSCT